MKSVLLCVGITDNVWVDLSRLLLIQSLFLNDDFFLSLITNQESCSTGLWNMEHCVHMDISISLSKRTVIHVLLNICDWF